ncbi:hypothetical protein EN45_063300 [Penicillium chrysogenum]|uniref:Uncharacterized protein n=1 Tax=Penicillium chrysogenum TaxID=5076 RepID=A0A167T0Y3_PENCH|nr:hypothetical protein EN45_063300 [Penicillium chrysogenum]
MITKLIDRLVASKHSAIFMNWGYPHVPVTRVEARKCIVCWAPRYRCDPTLYHPDMTIGGIDDEPM